MIYLKRCRCAEDEKNTSHRNIVRTEAHELLRSLLIQKNIPENKQEFIYNKYGKPMLKENDFLHFNLSHCCGLAVCAYAESPIGIDAEKIRDFPERVMKRCFTDREIGFVKNSDSPNNSFFQLWTLKESFVKAIGTGLSYPLKKAEFILENDCITANAEFDFSFVQIIIDNEFVCSVCCSNIFNNKILHRAYEDKITYESLMF